MIRILKLSKRDKSPSEISLEQLPGFLRQRDGIAWVDLFGEQTEHFEPVLKDMFQFHPLAIHDALHENHTAKLDQWDDYIYLVLHAPHNPESGNLMMIHPELDIFLGKNFLVTHHHEPLKSVEIVMEMCIKDSQVMAGGADHLVFRLAQEIIREHFHLLDDIEDQINRVEDRIFTERDSKIPEELFMFKRILLKERSTVGPMRDVFSQLVLDSNGIIDRKDRVFFRDIFEQALRLESTVTHLRDLVSSTLDTYLSVVNNRMNDTMRVMAIITTLFLPLTFITGFFGMNFFQAERTTGNWTGTVVFDVALIGMIIVPFLMFLWMKRRGMI